MVVIKDGCSKTWEEIKHTQGSVIGTSSVRRTAQLKGKYPNLEFQDIRGNLNTRLKKLDDPSGPYQAIILAAAGMKRLNFDERISMVMESDECLHAVSQGALAVECRMGDKLIMNLLEKLNHKDTVLSVIAERALMRVLVSITKIPKSFYTKSKNWSINKTMISGRRLFCPCRSSCRGQRQCNYCPRWRLESKWKAIHQGRNQTKFDGEYCG